MFREYNELPHTFEARLNRSYEGANKYVGLFTNGYAATLAKFVAYISGSFIAILLLVSVIDEAVLLYVRLSDHNLLWYLGIFSGIFAAAASFIPSQAHAQAAVGTAGSDYTRNKGSATRLQQMLNGTGMETTPAEQTMEVTAAQTHYFPRYWMHQCHTLHVRDEFLELFPYKTKLFAMEILSVLLTPLVLCFSLPNCVPDMLAFISRHTKYLDGVGDVCDYSTFDFDAYGNSDFLSPVDGDPNPKNGGYNFPSDARVGFINNMGSGIERQMINNNVIMRDRNSDGKLEQSYMSFRLANPGWTGGVSDPLSSQVPPVQNWISGKQSVGPSPLNNRMHTSGGGASISSSIRGGVEGLIPFANDIENGTPFSESIRNYDMTTAGDEMMQRIRAYRSHMAGEVSRSTGYSLTGSVRAISTASGIFPPVQDGKNLNPRHIPPLYPHPKYPIDGTRIAASTANYITDASYSPVESQLPSLTNIKNQVSRESTVSSVHDLYSGSKEEDEDCSDVEEVVAPITDNINYSLTPAEKEEHNRLFEECNNAQSFEYSQMSGVADVIDYSGLDRYSDGHDENRQALSIDDSIHNSIASILRSALKGEGGDIYENDFYWLNKYRSEKVRQSMMMSSSSVGSFRTAINGSIGESFAALYNNGSTSTHGSQSRHDVVSSRVISGSGRSAGSDAHQSSIAAELSARSRYSGSKVARTQSAGNPNFKSNLRDPGRSYNSENGNSTPDEMASV